MTSYTDVVVQYANTLLQCLKEFVQHCWKIFHFNPKKNVIIYNPINTTNIARKKEESVSEEFFQTNLPIIMSV